MTMNKTIANRDLKNNFILTFYYISFSSKKNRPCTDWPNWCITLVRTIFFLPRIESMLTAEQLDLVKQSLAPAKTVLVCLGPKANYDVVSAALGVKLSLEPHFEQVVLFFPGDLSEAVQEKPLVQSADFQNRLANQNLRVSFPYTPTSVDKVSYHIDEEQSVFNLDIRPKKGHKPLSEADVSFSQFGFEADVIIALGLNSWTNLGDIYEHQQEFFDHTFSVVLTSFDANIGSVKANYSGQSSASEAVAWLLSALEFSPTADAATQLLAGIEDATHSFRSLTASASTFSTASQLLSHQARRIYRYAPETSAQPVPSAQLDQPASMRTDQAVFSQALTKKKTKPSQVSGKKRKTKKN